MTRHKDSNWNLPNKVENYEQAHLAVLMDIRDELKENNKRLQRIEGQLSCYRIQDMFKDIARINKRIASMLPLRVKK